MGLTSKQYSKQRSHRDPKILNALYDKQLGLCAGCREVLLLLNASDLTVDHIIPKKEGGSDDLENLQLLCRSCNSIKGTKPQEYLLATLKDRNMIKEHK